MLVPVPHLPSLPLELVKALVPPAAAALAAPVPATAAVTVVAALLPRPPVAVVVLLLLVTLRLPTAVLLLPRLFPLVPKPASRALLLRSLAAWTTTHASASPQLRPACPRFWFLALQQLVPQPLCKPSSPELLPCVLAPPVRVVLPTAVAVVAAAAPAAPAAPVLLLEAAEVVKVEAEAAEAASLLADPEVQEVLEVLEDPEEVRAEAVETEEVMEAATEAEVSLPLPQPSPPVQVLDWR